MYTSAEPDHVTLLILMGNGNVHSRDDKAWRTALTDAIYRWKWPSFGGDDKDNKVRLYNDTFKYTSSTVHTYILFIIGCESIKAHKAIPETISHNI